MHTIKNNTNNLKRKEYYRRASAQIADTKISFESVFGGSS